jgi:hypothetical protein
MVLRWTTAALLSVEKRMRRVMGYQQVWILEIRLREIDSQKALARE